MNYKTPVDGLVELSFGDQLELTFDEHSMRELAEVSAAAVRELDRRAANART